MPTPFTKKFSTNVTAQPLTPITTETTDGMSRTLGILIKGASLATLGGMAVAMVTNTPIVNPQLANIVSTATAEGVLALTLATAYGVGAAARAHGTQRVDGQGKKVSDRGFKEKMASIARHLSFKV